jgi:hypothetical protein
VIEEPCFRFLNQICYLNRIEKCAIYNNEYNNKNQKPNPHSYIIIEYFNNNSRQLTTIHVYIFVGDTVAKRKCLVVWLFYRLVMFPMSWFLVVFLVVLFACSASSCGGGRRRRSPPPSPVNCRVSGKFLFFL